MLDYHEHAVGGGAQARAAAYLEVRIRDGGDALFGVGIDANIVRATLLAVLSATVARQPARCRSRRRGARGRLTRCEAWGGAEARRSPTGHWRPSRWETPTGPRVTLSRLAGPE